MLKSLRIKIVVVYLAWNESILVCQYQHLIVSEVTIPHGPPTQHNATSLFDLCKTTSISYNYLPTHYYTTRVLTVLRPRLPRWAGTRKVKPIWILQKQQTVSGSGISWTVCKSAPCSRQITTPAPRHSVFLQAGCPSCCPTNSVKALKAEALMAEAMKAELHYLPL